MSVAMIDHNWRADAACRGATDEELFPREPSDDRAVKIYCSYCPVRELCLADALKTGERTGIRGGMSEAARTPLHDACERRASSLIARRRAIGRKYNLTCDDRLELADMHNGVRRGRSQQQRQTFRLRLGELYEVGVDKSALLDAIEPAFPTRHAAERTFWRGVRQYREAYDREVARANRQYVNFLHMAQNASSEQGRMYWSAKAAAVVLP
jgi:WhiB family transcriptional regulator, redox-sensing transcriptional regulator